MYRSWIYIMKGGGESSQSSLSGMLVVLSREIQMGAEKESAEMKV